MSETSDEFDDILLGGKLRAVNTRLKHELIQNYEDKFEPEYLGEDNKLSLSEAPYIHPLGLIFEDGEMLLIFLPSKQELI